MTESYIDPWSDRILLGVPVRMKVCTSASAFELFIFIDSLHGYCMAYQVEMSITVGGTDCLTCCVSVVRRHLLQCEGMLCQ